MSDDPARLGVDAFEVEWCSDLPDDGCGGADMDAAKYQRRYLRERQFAEKFARIVFPKDKFGAVRITPVRLTDPHEGTQYAGIRSQFEWTPTGDSFEYSGEEQNVRPR